MDHGTTSDETAYDAYLDACLAGVAESPGTFLDRHPRTSAAVRAQIESCHRALCGDRAVPTDRDAPPFDRLGDFRLERRLGEGGMGVVYLAEQLSLGRPVALKVLRPELAGSGVAAERLRREALAVARLRHPNVVSVHAVGEDGSVRYVAMEFVPGQTLAERVADAAAAGTALPVHDVVSWCAQIAHALDCAHASGVIHRDVKPSNVRIAQEGRAMLLDFGLARLAEITDSSLTRTFAGSPRYAAPEQLAGAEVDGRADVYSLGATLYHALTGRAPNAGATLEEIVRRALVEDPERPGVLRDDVPRDLDLVVMKALAREPQERYATAAAFATDLEFVRDGLPVRARAPGRITRLRRAARRHPVRAMGFASLAFTLCVVVAISVWHRHEADVTRRREAADLVETARRRVEGFREGRERIAELELEVQLLHERLLDSFMTDEQVAALDRHEDEVLASRRERDGSFHEVLSILRRAEQRDPGVTGSDAVRAALYFEKWRDSVTARDPEAAAFYRELVLAGDPDDAVRAELTGLFPAAITSDPPGAEVFVFRHVDLGELVPEGEPRYVPVPLDGDPAIPPGTWALRAVRAGAGLLAEDLVVRVAGHEIRGSVLVARSESAGILPLDRLVRIGDAPVGDAWDVETAGADAPAREFEFDRRGERHVVRARSLAELRVVAAPAVDVVTEVGAPVTLLRGRSSIDMEVAPGAQLRTTAIPAALTEGARVGLTPIEDLRLSPGSYLVVLRRPGFETVRAAFPVQRKGGAPGYHAVLLPEHGTPPGFVHVCGRVQSVAPFFVMEREVICAEYLDFLNAAPGAASHAPRISSGGERWPRDGMVFRLPDGWRPDRPVLGVSWEDATAYAAWRSDEAAARGVPWRFGLPTLDEYRVAAGDILFEFPFGLRFRPRWTKSCYARPRATPEPVLSFPVDESPFGVFDLAGSAGEWLDAWFDEGRGLRSLAGGDWASADPREFRVWGAAGAPPTEAAANRGFRLVARPVR